MALPHPDSLCLWGWEPAGSAWKAPAWDTLWPWAQRWCRRASDHTAWICADPPAAPRGTSLGPHGASLLPADPPVDLGYPQRRPVGPRLGTQFQEGVWGFREEAGAWRLWREGHAPS